jgi:hypothetical protein
VVRLIVLCFTESSAVDAWEFVYDLQQLLAPLAICFQLQLVRSVVRQGALYFRATYISL